MEITIRKIKKDSSLTDSFINKNTETVKETNINVFVYNDKEYEQYVLEDLSNIRTIISKEGVKWINISGLGNIDIIETMGFQLGIHFLVLEDIMDIDQRPKFEDHSNYIYLVLKMIYLEDNAGNTNPRDKKEINEEEDIKKIISEQISFIVFKDIVITLQERVGDVFNPVRSKIINNKGKIRRSGADYLLYSLIDSIVDNYYNVLDDIEDDISFIEKELLKYQDKSLLENIYNLKIELIFMRKNALPLRDVINQLIKSDTEIISDNLIPYLKDVYDHAIQVVESIKVFTDTVSGILDIYMSSINNKTNEIMKVLTILSAIFIPLTFITGIFGMNFEHIPYLNHPVAFYYLSVFMFLLAISMILIFKKNKWI